MSRTTGTITDQIAYKLFGIFNSIIKDLSDFYGPGSKRFILFVTSEREDFYIVTVKFTKTFKRLRFYISKDSTTSVIQCDKLVKTGNIIEDIDNFYIAEHTEYIEKTALTREVIESLFMWGVAKSKNRKNDIYKVRGVDIDTTTLAKATDKNVLYYGKIAKVLSKKSDNFNTYGLVCTTGGTELKFSVPKGLEHLFSPGRLFIFNYEYRYNSFTLDQAKKHLIFSQSELKE